MFKTTSFDWLILFNKYVRYKYSMFQKIRKVIRELIKEISHFTNCRNMHLL